MIDDREHQHFGGDADILSRERVEPKSAFLNHRDRHDDADAFVAVDEAMT